MSSHHRLFSLLVVSCWLCLGSSFKNFPVVGLKEEPTAQEVIENVVEQEDDEVRAPRQAEPNGYQDPSLDDTFIEEALFLTPEDREEREFVPKLEDWLEEEAGSDKAIRPERDGFGAHAHTPHHEDMRQGRGRQSLRRQQEPLVARQQEQRAGRQTGAIAPALGLLSNPPNSEGDYNFNFANDDGSSRQEVSDPAGVRGSYSFITPEGEEVSIQYIADETGFHATGSHVPQAPPMPPAIRRMLDHLAKVNGHAKLY